MTLAVNEGGSMNRAARQVTELLALGIANGLALGTALAASHRGHALAIAVGAGTAITMVYLAAARWFSCR